MMALPDPVYTSWADYLAQTTWTSLRRRCCDTAKRANRKRLLSPVPQHRITPLLVWYVLSEARGRCAHCGSLAVERRPSDPHRGNPVTWEHIGRRIGSLEHKRTRFSGGDNDPANLAWCCLWCNTWPQERLRSASDHGGYYPDLHGEPDPVQSEKIIAAKYVAATRRIWSVGEAFAVGAKPEQLDCDDDQDFEMFPDHECPLDVAVLR